MCRVTALRADTRTNPAGAWPKHAVGQTLHVKEGVGYVQYEGKI